MSTTQGLDADLHERGAERGGRRREKKKSGHFLFSFRYPTDEITEAAAQGEGSAAGQETEEKGKGKKEKGEGR